VGVTGATGGVGATGSVGATGATGPGFSANTWHALTLQNGWLAYGSGFPTPAYRKEGDRVWLRGLIYAGTTTDGTTLFTLPSGYLPAYIVNMIVYANTSGGGGSTITYTALVPQTSGAVQIYHGSGIYYIGLDQVSISTVT
jgi:hypothetical protein